MATENMISEIQEFYNGRSVFITGVTGFMGKIMLEKLIRSCPGLKNIYTLVRKKKGKDPKQRFEELMASKVFDLIRKECPENLSKVVCLFGDISRDRLGLSEEDENLILDNVTVVIHNAAIIKFMEPLDVLVNMNVLGTRRVIQLCQKMRNQVVLVYLSTAYCNCNQPVISEYVYPSPVSPQKVIDVTEWMSREALEAATPKMMGKHHVPYSFSKSLAETLVMEERGDIPTAIVRPSAVSSTWKEPMPGWIDSINGIGGLMIGAGLGVLRTVYVDENKIFDFVPVDVCSNLTIAAGWYVGTQRPENIMVYNLATGCREKLTTNRVLQFLEPYVFEYPASWVYRFPNGGVTSSKLRDRINRVIQHYIPGACIDFVRILCFKKPLLLPLYKKIHKLLDASEFYITNNFKFKSNNVEALNELMSDKDKEIFNFDIQTLEWRDYFVSMCSGVRKYLFNEDDSTLSKDKRYMLMRYYLSNFIDIAAVFGVYKFFISRYITVEMIWNTLLSTMGSSSEQINDDQMTPYG